MPFPENEAQAQKALISREKKASIKEKYEPAGGLRDAERSFLGAGALQAEVRAAALCARGHPAYGRSVNTKAMVYLHRGFFHFPRRVAEAAGQHGKEALS